MMNALPSSVLMPASRTRAISVGYPDTNRSTLLVPLDNAHAMATAQRLLLSRAARVRTTIRTVFGRWGRPAYFKDGPVLEHVRSLYPAGAPLVAKTAVARCEARMTAALLDRDSRPAVFVKIVGPRSSASMSNECTWLSRLSNLSDLRGRMPVPVRHWAMDDVNVLELRPVASSGRHVSVFSECHERFLDRLQSNGERYAQHGETLPSRIARRLTTLASAVSPALIEMLTAAERDLQCTWPTVSSRVVAHGDFTPWNTLTDGDRMCVVDWESAAGDCPPMYDYLHFTLFPLAVRRRLRPSDLARVLAPSPRLAIRRWQQTPALASRQCLAYLLDAATSYLEADDGTNEGSGVMKEYARLLRHRADWLW